MSSTDVAVVGAGAAGLAAAIFAARAAPAARVTCLDGARRIGAKILVSGGSRCNVTNRIVTERDFWGGSSRTVKHALRAFPAERAADFFCSLGVPLHEEEDGKLFPDSNRSRDVLTALLDEAARLNVVIATGRRVSAVERRAAHFLVETGGQPLEASVVVLATGGRSLPKTGSDGFGYELARRLGHGYVPTTPALAPLVIATTTIDHASLAGVSHRAALTLRVERRSALRLEGPLLWTHFGVSGPVALDMSRHWHRATLDGGSADVELSMAPGETFESLESWLLVQERDRPRTRPATVLSMRLPAALAEACANAAGIQPDVTFAHLTRDQRRRLVRLLVEFPLNVCDSRGYSYAEVTAGGIPLDEIDSSTMQSRVCQGLYLVGEILDVDGRLGGFNFQWAWSSGWVAGHAIARALRG